MTGPWDLPLGWAIFTAITTAISICVATIELAKFTYRRKRP